MSLPSARVYCSGRLYTLTLALAVGVSVGATGCSRTSSRASTGESATTVAAESAAGATTSTAGDSSAAIVESVDSSMRPANMPGAAKPSIEVLDTARGIVQRIGADPLSTLVLVPREGVAGNAFALVSASPDTSSSVELAAAEGLEVVVRGTRTTQRATGAGPNGAPVFRVLQFVVRAADGVPARDGVLVQRDGQWMLEAPDGSRSRIVALPAALQSQRGARIFLAGPPTQAPQAFGILRAK